MAGSKDLPLSSSTGGFEGAGEQMAHEVLIIGGGLAGLRAALAASEAGADVAVLSKVHPLRSHSVAAQGGINAALGEDDSVESHAFDTVKGSDYLADQDVVMVLASEAPARVLEMEHLGTVFSRTEDGRIAQRPFGGAAFPRTAYAQDRTGHNLLHTLYEACVREGLHLYDEFFVTRLVVAGQRCIGVIALDVKAGQLHAMAASSVVIATGGHGRVFARSTNALINTGDGAALAYRAGVPLQDMEFVQFHPTTLFGSNILITEGARGEGGHLLNGHGERFMERYAPKAMELAPRDIVARAIQSELGEGRGIDGRSYVHLDLRHLGAERIKERLPGIRGIAMDFAGVDPIEAPVPVQPGQHYSMGGVACGVNGTTELPGLFTAGEAACVSVHGANRLGGNSLLETLVFGRRAGVAAAEHASHASVMDEIELQAVLREEVIRINEIMSRTPKVKVGRIRRDLREAMFAHYGVFREGPVMEEGLEVLGKLRAQLTDTGVDFIGNVFNQPLIAYLELEYMMDVAEAVAASALAREESRGSHFRRDFPERDDKGWLRHTLAYRTINGPRLEYEEVSLGHFEVKERAY